MVKHLLILPFLLFSSLLSEAQESTNVEDLFKLQLFLDKKNLERYTEGVIKNDSLYQTFEELRELNIDTLKAVSKLGYVLSIDQFKYFQIDLTKKGIVWKETLKEPSNRRKSLVFSYGAESVFILCINIETGKVYRLRGFNGNDFLSYLRDFKEVCNQSYAYRRGLSNRTFFKNYQVSGLDFKCLYKGLTSRKKYLKYKYYREYPCLRRCSEPIIIG